MKEKMIIKKTAELQVPEIWIFCWRVLASRRSTWLHLKSEYKILKYSE